MIGFNLSLKSEPHSKWNTQVLASLGHSCCPSCGNRPRFQRESLYRGVFYPGSDTKYQNLKFDKPLPPVVKPALVMIDLVAEEDEVMTSTMQEGVTDKVMEVVKGKDEVDMMEEEVNNIEKEEGEKRAVIFSPEVELIEKNEIRDLVVFEEVDEEMFKEEETVAVKFGFSGSNRDSGFSSSNSSEVELELNVENEDDEEKEEVKDLDKENESTDDILARYKSVNMDFSVELPAVVRGIEYLRDSTITVDLADKMLDAALDVKSDNQKDEEKNAKEKAFKADSNSVIELDFDDSAIDVDTPEKEPEGAVISEMDKFTKKLVTLNRKHRNEIGEDFQGEKTRQPVEDERGRKPKISLETEEIISLEKGDSQLDEGKDEAENCSKERSQNEKEKAEILRKKKAKRVSWQDEVSLEDSLEIKDQPPIRKRERSRSQDSQEDEEDLKEDSKRKARERNEKKRNGEHKKMRKRDRSCSQDSQEEEEENDDLTPEERKSYEERVKENLRKIKKRPIQERKIVHGRNMVSLATDSSSFLFKTQ